MYKYFENLLKTYDLPEVSDDEISSYKTSLIACLKKLGVRDSDINLVCDEMIQNSILCKTKPEDTARAILQ